MHLLTRFVFSNIYVHQFAVSSIHIYVHVYCLCVHLPRRRVVENTEVCGRSYIGRVLGGSRLPLVHAPHARARPSPHATTRTTPPLPGGRGSVPAATHVTNALQFFSLLFTLLLNSKSFLWLLLHQFGKVYTTNFRLVITSLLSYVLIYMLPGLYWCCCL